jgi:dihydrofolate synthase/folylpolyglutamate synthase
MLSDKDVPAVLAALKGSIDLWFAAATDGPRGLSDTDLATHAAGLGIAMTPSGAVPDAMQAAARVARPGDRVVVFGSFHTVGPALSCV